MREEKNRNTSNEINLTKIDEDGSVRMDFVTAMV